MTAHSEPSALEIVFAPRLPISGCERQTWFRGAFAEIAFRALAFDAFLTCYKIAQLPFPGANV
jgi:hypothetical protein